MRSGVKAAVVTAALGLMITSCSPADGDQSAEQPSTPEATVATETDVEAEPEDEGEDGEEALAPIEGYADFSGESYHEVDWVLWSHLMVRCMRDQGFPAEITPPDGISFQAIPSEQNQQAQRVFDACREGMNTPDEEPHTREFKEKIYDYSLARRECLIEEGYDIPPPPSREEFVDNFFDPDRWAIARFLPDTIHSSWDSVEIRCPSRPPGGWGAWEPGDPVEPLTQPDVDLDD